MLGLTGYASSDEDDEEEEAHVISDVSAMEYLPRKNENATDVKHHQTQVKSIPPGQPTHDGSMRLSFAERESCFD